MTTKQMREALIKAGAGWMIERDPRNMTADEVERAYRRIFG